MAASAPHPIHRRYYAEDLVRLRRASESRRYAGSQRRGKIDPNPHQIDAVMFALRRIPEGGLRITLATPAGERPHRRQHKLLPFDRPAQRRP